MFSFPVNTNQSLLECHSLFLRIFADRVHPFMATMYPSFHGYFQHDNAPGHRAKVISNLFHEHYNEFNVLQWPSQSPDLSPVEQLWDVVELEIYSMNVRLANLQKWSDRLF